MYDDDISILPYPSMSLVIGFIRTPLSPFITFKDDPLRVSLMTFTGLTD